ncbi:signal peptidase II, partial [bacterium]|nr:signal peptidase II [bacterium]
MTRFHRYAPWLLVVVIVFLDQLTKKIVMVNMNLYQSIPFMGNAVRWTYIHNDGLLFGIDLPAGGRVLGIMSLIATVVVAVILYRMRREPLYTQLLFAGIMGGAIGNTIDRLWYGYVIDFIDVDLPDWIMHR